MIKLVGSKELALRCLWVVCFVSAASVAAAGQRVCGLDARNSHNVALPQIDQTQMAPELAAEIHLGFDLSMLQGRGGEGTSILKRALAQAEAGGDRCAQALALYGMADVLRASDMAASVAMFQKSEALLEDEGTPLALAYVHERIASAKHFTGDNAGFLRDDPAVQQELHDAGDDANAIKEKSQALQWAEGPQRPEQQAALLKQLEGVTVANRTAALGLVEWNAGSSMRRTGRYAEIAAHFKAALAALAECDCDHGTRAAILLTMAAAADGAHDAAAEMDYAQQADAIYRKYHLETLRPQALRLLAGAYAAQGDLPKAIATYEDGLRLAHETKSLAAVPNLGLEEAVVLGESGQPEKGLALIVATGGAHPSPTQKCATVAARMTLESQAKRYEETKVDFQTASAECKELIQPSAMAALMWRYADVELEHGHPEDGLAQAQASVQIIDSQRQRVQPTDRALQAYNEQESSAYNALISSLVQLKRPEEALLASEQFRARSFVDLAESRRPDAPIQASAAAAPPAPVGAGRRSEQNLRSEAHPFALTIADIRKNLDAQHATLVSYWLTDNGRLYTWVMAPDKAVFQIERTVSPVQLASLVKATLPGESVGARRGVQVATRGGGSATLTTTSRKPWHDLYDLLIAPIADQLPQQPGSLLTIVPQGQLFQLSFPALMDPTGHYLVERYATNTVPSAGVLEVTAANDVAASKLATKYLLVANPMTYPSVEGRVLPALPGTAAEVKSISRELGGSSITLLEGRQAGIDSLIQSLPQATVLHMATHAVVSDTAPLTSFLALDREQRGGLLTARSVYGLHMKTKLVVLSACSTGRGEISGDGVAGLSRAFFYAGAASLVTTLWDVVDQPTAELMARYYAALAKGESRSGALRTAQLSLIHDLRRHSIKVETLAGGQVSLPEKPAFWAAFSLSGQP